MVGTEADVALGVGVGAGALLGGGDAAVVGGAFDRVEAVLVTTVRRAVDKVAGEAIARGNAGLEALRLPLRLLKAML